MCEKVIFLIGGRTGTYGSGVLRSNQLLEIVSPQLKADGIKSELTSIPSGIHNSVVIVSKTFIYDNSAFDLYSLKRQSNVIACDFVDLPLQRNICQVSDILISSSHLQDAFFRKSYSNKKTFFIPHHSDLRISETVNESGMARVGYFGAPYNALYGRELEADGVCDIISVDNAFDTSWINKLKDYKIHYSARKRHRFDGFKPFTKGSIAARVGAVVITDRNAETVLCLGPDYPFFLEDDSLEEVRRRIAATKTACGSRDWEKATMALRNLDSQCSADAISRNFRELVLAAFEIRDSSEKPLGKLGFFKFAFSEAAFVTVKKAKKIIRQFT